MLESELDDGKSDDDEAITVPEELSPPPVLDVRELCDVSLLEADVLAVLDVPELFDGWFIEADSVCAESLLSPECVKIAPAASDTFPAAADVRASSSPKYVVKTVCCSLNGAQTNPDSGGVWFQKRVTQYCWSLNLLFAP